MRTPRREGENGASQTWSVTGRFMSLLRINDARLEPAIKWGSNCQIAYITVISIGGVNGIKYYD